MASSFHSPKQYHYLQQFLEPAQLPLVLSVRDWRWPLISAARLLRSWSLREFSFVGSLAGQPGQCECFRCGTEVCDESTAIQSEFEEFPASARTVRKDGQDHSSDAAVRYPVDEDVSWEKGLAGFGCSPLERGSLQKWDWSSASHESPASSWLPLSWDLMSSCCCSQQWRLLSFCFRSF